MLQKKHYHKLISGLFRASQIIRDDGFPNLWKILFKKLKKDFYLIVCKSSNYDDWIRDNELSLGDIQSSAHLFASDIKISLVMPVYNSNTELLKAAIGSVTGQVYSNWELCISACCLSDAAYELLKSLKDPKIKVIISPLALGISENTNNAIQLTTGEYVGFVDHDDVLNPNALLEISKVIKSSNPDLIYSDEDKINLVGKRSDPHFKPDFSPELLLSMNYICHFLVLRKSSGNLLGWFRSQYDGSQDHDLLLRCVQQKLRFHHVPKILYHWRVSDNSILSYSGNKTYAHTSGLKCVEKHLDIIGVKGVSVMDGPDPFTYKFQSSAPKGLVSIIIPNKDNVDVLDKCISSVVEKSTYHNFEIIIVENNSSSPATFEFYEALKERLKDKLKLLHWQGEFNYSAINNFAVKYAQGEFLLFLNNDIEVISPDWIERLLDHGQREEIGVVGAKLFYPDNTIQHAGVIIGIGGVAGHSHKHFLKSSRGYSNRLQVTQNVSAVTGACLLIKRSTFSMVNGFDENIKVAFNDVDLCLKVHHAGFRNVWTPYAELYHYESKTRGVEDSKEKIQRFNGEVSLMKEKWKDFLQKGDPYYNENLTLISEDFAIKNTKLEHELGMTRRHQTHL